MGGNNGSSAGASGNNDVDNDDGGGGVLASGYHGRAATEAGVDGDDDGDEDRTGAGTQTLLGGRVQKSSTVKGLVVTLTSSLFCLFSVVGAILIHGHRLDQHLAPFTPS